MNDCELWQKIIEGDNEAWARLIRKYQSLVYAVSTRAGLSLSDCADCFQQTWVILFKNRHHIKDPARLSAWLVTTAKREALRLRRRAERFEEDAEDFSLISEDPLPDREVELLECQAQLEIALKEIDTRCRNVLKAFFYAPEEKSYDEIAKAFGIPANSLGPIRRRCLERLKQILLKTGYFEERNEGKEPL
ncbi:putative RNA polymerase sigma factor, sigma-70 family [Candidatus Zixiibacteriota bacterium]|nr:putative RNA polymerase sigma factor, sigma-70 family [candidate division Zixibacteria bacterium]